MTTQGTARSWWIRAMRDASGSSIVGEMNTTPVTTGFKDATAERPWPPSTSASGRDETRIQSDRDGREPEQG
jgi:hypothetical protein